MEPAEPVMHSWTGAIWPEGPSHPAQAEGLGSVRAWMPGLKGWNSMTT